MSRKIIGAFFVVAGTLHFVRPRPFEAIVPPFVPYPELAVQVSGVAEILGGAAIISPRTRGFARWWLIALLVAVYPANIHIALHPDQIRGLEETGIPAWAHWVRLPLQPLMVWWIWRTTQRPVSGLE